MAYENIQELVTRADLLLDSDKYAEAYTQYEKASNAIMEVLEKTRTSRKVAKGAGWVAAILTGGLGVEDLLIVPAVNKMVQSMLGIDINQALALLYKTSTQKLLILGLSREVYAIAPTKEVLLDCLIAYKLISEKAEKGLLDEVLELANPFSESSPLTGEERNYSEQDLTEFLYREMGRTGIRVSYLNALLYQFLLGKGITSSRLFHFLEEFVRQNSGDFGNAHGAGSDDDAERYGRMFGLKGQVTKDEIRKKYREFMKQYHPDKYTNASEGEKRAAEEKAKGYNEAYAYFKKKFNL